MGVLKSIDNKRKANKRFRLILSDALAAPVQAEEAGQIVDRELAHLCKFRRSFESAPEDPRSRS